MVMVSATGAKPNATAHGIMKEYWDKVIMVKTPQQLGLCVLQFRYRKAKVQEGADPKERRGILAMALNQLDEDHKKLWPILVNYLLEGEGAEALAGAAPKGPLQREVARLLGRAK